MVEWGMHEMVIETPADLGVLARRVLEVAGERRASRAAATVLALFGELGAGKTAFTQALAEHLGVVAQVTSSTFVVMRFYPIPAHDFFRQLVHSDAYRVESLAEMEVLGFDDVLKDEHNLICIEWAERVADMLPKDAVHVSFAHSGTTDVPAPRTVTYGYRDG